jgi:peptide/nickel transport system permease protein
MTGYLIRRIFQMIGVVLISAVFSYAILNFAPGGPMAGLRQTAQSARFRITEEDIIRIRQYFELDLYLPVRFSRWLIGQPRGPLTIGGKTYLGDLVVGCSVPVQAQIRDKNGNISTRTIGCNRTVTLNDLVGRRTSNGVLALDFGRSWTIMRDRPVSDLLKSRLPKTMQLLGIELIISLAIAVPLGIYSAVKQYSKFDYFFTTLAFMGSAMPTFFFGILMILFFSVVPKMAGWPYLPPGSSIAVRDYVIPYFGTVKAGSITDTILHLILPVLVLVFVSVSGWSRYIRASMLDVLRQDYIRTARAKGLKERVVIVKHALRNALIPFITIIVFSIPTLFGGALITETVFSWPGMGRLYVLALGQYDYPVNMAILFITAVLTVIATLLRDILYTVVDPRIRFS